MIIEQLQDSLVLFDDLIVVLEDGAKNGSKLRSGYIHRLPGLSGRVRHVCDAARSSEKRGRS
jgi:hypothetical protein